MLSHSHKTGLREVTPITGYDSTFRLPIQ